MTVLVTLSMTDEQKAMLDELARRQHAPVKAMLLDGIERMFDYDTRLRAKVQEGLDDIAAGRVYTHEEVVEMSRERREELLARAAKA